VSRTVPPIDVVSGSAVKLVMTGALFPQLQKANPINSSNGIIRLFIPKSTNEYANKKPNECMRHNTSRFIRILE
jgi:hypothetical protein